MVTLACSQGSGSLHLWGKLEAEDRGFGFKVRPQLPRDEIPSRAPPGTGVEGSAGALGACTQPRPTAKPVRIEYCFSETAVFGSPRGRRGTFSVSWSEQPEATCLPACLPTCRAASLSSGPAVLRVSPRVASCHRPFPGALCRCRNHTKSEPQVFLCTCVVREVQVGGPVRDTSRTPVRNEPPLHKPEGNRIVNRGQEAGPVLEARQADV